MIGTTGMNTRNCVALTHAGALRMLEGAVRKAVEIGLPVSIFIVDSTGSDIVFLRMDGALLLSMPTARAKTRTAASYRCATTDLGPDFALRAAAASAGQITNLAGGLPIFVGDVCVGGIGVGSASDEGDVAIAMAGLAAIGTERSFVPVRTDRGQAAFCDTG
jgi:uncharacterized protein GlcG (DUF336 family)